MDLAIKWNHCQVSCHGLWHQAFLPQRCVVLQDHGFSQPCILSHICKMATGESGAIVFSLFQGAQCSIHGSLLYHFSLQQPHGEGRLRQNSWFKVTQWVLWLNGELDLAFCRPSVYSQYWTSIAPSKWLWTWGQQATWYQFILPDYIMRTAYRVTYKGEKWLRISGTVL